MITVRFGLVKPSEVCKSAGLKSLAELSGFSGESVQTLNNWYKSEPRRFELVLKGVLFEQSMKRLALATITKKCVMNCGAAEGDSRTKAEVKLNCDDCDLKT